MVNTNLIKENHSTRSPILKEYFVSFCASLYPAYKIQRVLYYALSGDEEEACDDLNTRQIAKFISCSIACLSTLQISYIAQKLLGVLRKRKYNPQTKNLFLSILFATPALIEGYGPLKSYLSKKRFSTMQSNFIMLTSAMIALLAANTIVRKV